MKTLLMVLIHFTFMVVPFKSSFGMDISLDFSNDVINSKIKNYRITYSVVTNKCNKNMPYEDTYKLSDKSIKLNSNILCLRKKNESLITMQKRITLYALSGLFSTHDQKYFQDLSNWSSRKKSLAPAKGRQPKTVYKNKNTLHDRGIEKNELSNIKRYYSYNFSFYFTDSEYPCRRPSLTIFFNTQFNELKKCSDSNIYYNLSSNQNSIYKFDLNKVYQVHYFFASEGEAMMSKWGHAMIRLVICAPHRVKVDKKCMEDVSHHLVVNYRANVNDLKINNIKGIFGSYKSQIFYTTIKESINEYNKNELRDLISLPLKISKQEIKLLVNRLNEEYWSYAGSYKFFSRNCATEVADILKLIDYKNLHTFNSSSPLGLYEELIDKELVDTSFLSKESSAQTGHLYVSRSKSLKNALTNISNALEKSITRSEWIEETSATERKRIFNILKTSFKNKASAFYKIQASFAILENYALSEFTKDLNEYIAQLSNQDVLDIENQEARSLIFDIRKNIIKKLKYKGPWQDLNKNSYGAITIQDIRNIKRKQKKHHKYSVSINYLKIINPRLQEENNNIINNINYFYKY